jgi:hypothetical protein
VKLRRTYVDRALTDVVLDESMGVHPKALADILGRAYQVFEVSDDGKLTPKRGEAVVYGADGVTPMSPKEWVQSLKEDAPYFFKGSNGGGSNGGEGGMVHGIAAATGTPLEFVNGTPTARSIGDYGLPILRDAPEVTVELIESDEERGGVTELAVPTAAPALANALFALTGQRLRALPLVIGSRT